MPSDEVMFQQHVRHRHKSVVLYAIEKGWLASLHGEHFHAEGKTVEEACAALWERWRAKLIEERPASDE